jgi:two-component system, OmpR family, sensor kinase
MAEQDVLESPPAPPGQRASARVGLLSGFGRLSDRTPLRTKLIAAVLALVILALAAISVASVIVLQSYLFTQKDPQLQRQFSSIVGQAQAAEANDTPVTNVAVNTQYPLGPGTFYGFQTAGNQVLPEDNQGGPSLGMRPQQSQPALPAGRNWAPTDHGIVLNLPSQSGGDTWRVFAQTVTFPIAVSETQSQQTTSTLVVAADLGPVGAEVQRLITVELIVGVAIVVVIAVVGVGVVRANLRPLDDIEMTAGEIAKGHLYHRIPERDPRTEVGSLGRSLNAMLTQVESAFRSQQESEQAAHQSEERMRRFIADASHELRTPLTTIRGFAAHYRQRGGASSFRSRLPARPGENQGQPRGTDAGDSFTPVTPGGADNLSPEDLDHLMARVESEATRMGLLVEDLLTLARLDQQRPLANAPVDLLTLAADAVQDARIVSPGRPIELTVAPGTAFLVDGDEPRLRQVLANLVNNAITHTPDGTPVRVTISRGTLDDDSPDDDSPDDDSPDGGGPAVVLDVADDGPGMTADQAQRVFERFYRADAARNRASGGTGLGLAIVAGLVSAHGGTVGLRTAPGEGADFQVKLPLSPDVLAADLDDADEEPLV